MLTPRRSRASNVLSGPLLARAAVIRDPDISLGAGQFAVVQTAAPSLGIEAKPVNVADPAEIERVIAAFARSDNGGLIVTASGLAALHRNVLVTLAARHRLPAVYFERYFVTAGGLISYGTSVVEQHRLGVTYIDRILRGEKPADLPVQAPNKYELVVNLKAAKALGLSGPRTLLAPDDVIEWQSYLLHCLCRLLALNGGRLAQPYARYGRCCGHRGRELVRDRSLPLIPTRQKPVTIPQRDRP